MSGKVKKILVLGASANQVQLIISAKECGYYVVVCDWDYNNPGVKYADKHYLVSALNREEILKIALQENIAGVVSNSEPAMANVAYISERLNLVGNPESSIKILNSKDLFRNLQCDLGIYAPKHKAVKTFEELIECQKYLQYPIIIKPVECSGSRGTKRIDNFEKDILQKAFNENISFSRNGECSVEEYVEMPSLEVIDGDIFVNDSTILWDGLFLSVRSKRAPMVPMAQIYPLVISEEKRNEIKNTISRVIFGAGIRHGEYNIEMYFNKQGQPFVIEINARQGGCAIPQMIQQHTGIDMNKLLVTTAMADNSYFTELQNCEHPLNIVARYYIFSDVDGSFRDLYIDNRVEGYITDTTLLKKNGDRIEKCRNAESVIAYVNMKFESYDEQRYITHHIEELIYPIVI